MATVAQEELVKLSINDVEIEVPKGELIVEAVKRLGLEIPIFCYHPRLKPVGMCRMCLVEVGFKQPDGSVRMMPKPQAGCTLPADNNMVVYTDTESVHRDRKGVLEFLLVNHPLDCPICDRGGECPLQNNTMAYGPSTSRFIELKRHLPKAYPLSRYVTLDLERCIQCGRCVRFTEEISGDSQLAFRFRGASMQPSTFQLTDFESRFSGNVIEICPVGALTSSKYRFRARPWDLETAPGICTITPCGTNIWLDHRAGKLVRINGRTNESVNEEWTFDRTKFGYDFYNAPDRLTAPNSRRGDGFGRISWAEAHESISSDFTSSPSSAMIVSPTIANEALYLSQKVAREVFGTANIDHRSGTLLLGREERVEGKFGVPSVQNSIADMEFQDAILVFGTSLAEEQPMTFLRVRKGWFQNGTKVVVANDRPTEADSFAAVVLHYNPGTAGWVAGALATLLGAPGASVDVSKACATSGIDENRLREAADLLKEGSRAFVTTPTILDSPTGDVAYGALAVSATHSGATFNCFGLHSNSAGATELGVLPDTLPGGTAASVTGKNTREILEAASKGEIKSLFLVGFDPIDDFGDADLATKALEMAETVIYFNSVPGSSAAYATMVLPMALPAESDGTFTSCERRVQRLAGPLSAPGESKSPWRVFSEILMRASNTVPAFQPADTLKEIAAVVPSFGGISNELLAGEGLMLAQTFGATPNFEPLAQTLAKLQ